MKKAVKYFTLYNIGGMVYYLLEVLYRGYSHWTMYLLSGLLFVAIGLINELFSWETPFLKQCVIGSVVTTILEFIVGCVVNIWLKWDVWDYSQVWGNILGQVCIPYSILWLGLSGIAIVVDDWLRYYIFDEEKPHYKLL